MRNLHILIFNQKKDKIKYYEESILTFFLLKKKFN